MVEQTFIQKVVALDAVFEANRLCACGNLIETRMKRAKFGHQISIYDRADGGY